MSDLEQSDNEQMSDDDTSPIKNIKTSKPSFPKLNTKTNSTKPDLKMSGLILKPPTDSNVNIGEEDLGEDVDEDVEEEELESSSDDDVDSVISTDNDDDISIDEESGVINKKKTTLKKPTKQIESIPSTAKLNIPSVFEKNDSDYESNDDEEEEDDYLQKFDREMRDNYILEQHPESINHNYDEIYNLAKVQRNKDNIIVDDLHRTIPILTKYEKTRILGQRAKQLNNGAKPLVKFAENIIDGYLIALKELEEKKIPIIIRRPLPNGASEYWHLRDLEILC